MCGRFTLRTPEKEIAEAFDLLGSPEIPPRFNIAPTQESPVVCLNVESKRRELHWMRWGLIPGWSRDPAIGSRMINARSETIDEKPAFKACFLRKRCLIPADGFYEWRAAGQRKQPYYIHRHDDEPFAFAGLWDMWRAPTGDSLTSFTIITTDANKTLSRLHDRMPVILAPMDYSAWLDPDDPPADRLKELLKPCPDKDLTFVAVSTRVNAPSFDDPSCIVPVTMSDPESAGPAT